MMKKEEKNIEKKEELVASLKKLEDELKIKNIIFNNSEASNSISDPNGFLIDVNPAFLKITGFSKKEEVIGKPVSYFFKNKNDALEVLKKLKKDKKWSGEIVVKRKDGSTSIAYGSCSILFDEEGKVRGYQSSMYDISERKKIEEKLKESEEKYRIISEKSKAAMMLTLPDKTVSYLSPSSLEVFGWPAKDLMGKVPNIFYPEDQEIVFRRLSEVIKGKSFKNFRYRVLGKDKKVYWISHSANPLFDHGKLIEIVSVIINIDEIVKAEEEVKESEDKFRSLYLSMREGVALHEIVYGANKKPINYRILGVNPQYHSMIGIPPSKVINKLATEVYKTKEAPYLKEYSQVAETQKPYFFETYFPPLNKYFSISVISPKKGNFDTVFTDITERKKAEEKIREYSERLQIATRAGHIGIWDWDVVNDKLIWDDVICELYGVPPGFFKDGVGAWSEYIIEEDRPRVLAELEAALRGEGEYCPEFRIKWPNGEIHIMKANSQAFFDKKGKVIRMVGTNIDITERKKAEEELRKAKENIEAQVEERTAELQKQTTFLSSVLENVPDMIFVKDAKDLRFELFNKAGEELLGQNRKNLIHKNDYDFFPKKQADFFTQKDRAVLNSKNLLDIPQEPIKTKSGEKILHTKKIPILGSNGESKYLLGISEDITERKKYEDQLKQRNIELETFNKAAVGRELKMVELKKKIAQLEAQLAQIHQKTKD